MIESEEKNWFRDWLTDDAVISHRVKHEAADCRTRFQRVRILDTRDLGRILVLDNKIQSAELDEYIYHEALVHPAMLSHPHPGKVLLLGGGEGATLREILRHETVEQVTMVDIDGELVDICREHLPQWSRGAFDDPRTRLHIMDAVEFVNTTSDRYDVVICDLSDPVESGPASALYAREFYQEIRNVMTEGGVFATQALEVFYHYLRLHAVIHSTVEAVFKTCRSYCEYVHSFGAMWGFVLGFSEPASKLPDADRVDRLLQERGVTGLEYLDGEAFVRLFSLPKMVAQAVGENTDISTRDHLIHVFAG